jgi:hypothetical protein
MRGKASVILLAATCLLLMGLSANGYSQQQSETVQSQGAKQPPAAPQPALKWPRREAAGLQVVADLSVTPLNYTGSCPATFTFKGQIYANRATEVQYKFVRSDGVHTEAKTLTFEKEGRQEVTYTWQATDAETLPAFRGSVVMQVVYPLNVKIRSNEAVFRGTCTSRDKPVAEKPSGQQATQQTPPPMMKRLPQPTETQGPPAAAGEN